MKQSILHINIHGNQSDVGSHHQEKPGCRCFACLRVICDSYVKQQLHTKLTKSVSNSAGRACLCEKLKYSQNHFASESFLHKATVFLPPLTPSFFLLPSAVHNSAHYDGCPQALEWIPWTRQDSTLNALFSWILHRSQLSDDGRAEVASTPFLFSDRKRSDSGFFPPFSRTLFWLFCSFCQRLQNFLFDIIAPVLFFFVFFKENHYFNSHTQPLRCLPAAS